MFVIASRVSFHIGNSGARSSDKTILYLHLGKRIIMSSSPFFIILLLLPLLLVYNIIIIIIIPDLSSSSSNNNCSSLMLCCCFFLVVVVVILYRSSPYPNPAVALTQPPTNLPHISSPRQSRRHRVKSWRPCHTTAHRHCPKYGGMPPSTMCQRKEKFNRSTTGPP